VAQSSTLIAQTLQKELTYSSNNTFAAPTALTKSSSVTNKYRCQVMRGELPNPHGWLRDPESIHSRLSVLTGLQTRFEPKFLDPRAKLSSNKRKTLSLWNEKNSGKTGLSIFARQYSTVAVPLGDLSIGAALLTSSELFFGTLIGDPWVDVARL
jgi:hypothetical protein